MSESDKKFILPEFLHCGVFSGSEYINFHSHPGTELVLSTDGRCMMEVCGTKLEGGSGCLFVLPAAKAHSQINEGFVRTIYFTFRAGDFFDERPRVLDISEDKWVPFWMEELVRMNHSVKDDLSASMGGFIHAVLKRVQTLENTLSGGQKYHPAVSLALEYINSNLCEKFSLEDVAVQSGVSQSYLCALFEKEFGRGPLTLALELKMKYAGRLLKDPYSSIKETALACGFSDPNYFARFFRKEYGVSPSEYRDEKDFSKTWESKFK